MRTESVKQMVATEFEVDPNDLEVTYERHGEYYVKHFTNDRVYGYWVHIEMQYLTSIGQRKDLE